jgi:NADPH-dependent curcumin reductase CurA
MAYTPNENELGIQPIALNSTTQNHPLGKIIRANDPTFGQGEFVYLLGVASTVVGNTVVYSTTTYLTALSPNTANNVNPLAVAMSANVAAQYGWYQIGGLAVVKKTAVQVLPNAKIFQSGTAGRWMPTSTAGMHIMGARGAALTTVTSTVSTMVVLLNRPCQENQLA